jgi:Thioredoxin-like
MAMRKFSLLASICVALLAGCAATSQPRDAAVARLTAQGRAVVLMFVRVDCPISNSYAPELQRIIHDYEDQKIAFDLVYVDEHLTLQQARQHAAEFGYHCAVRVDENRVLVGKFKIDVTPEVAVVSPAGDVLYRGRIDDTYAAFGKKRFAPTTHELRDALDAIVQGHAVAVSNTTAVGCSIQ